MAVESGMKPSGPALGMNEELTSLQNALEKVRDGFSNEWTGMSQGDSHIHKHSQTMDSLEDQLSGLGENLQELQSKESNKRKVCEKAEDEIKTMRTELESLKQDTDNILREKDIIHEKVSKINRENKDSHEEVASLSEAMKTNVADLEKSLGFFNQRMGLRFKKVSGNRLQVIFTCLDAKDPSQPCCICVKLAADRSYEVTDCDPHVPELPALIEKLNSSNNFRSFIIAMRKQFKMLV